MRTNAAVLLIMSVSVFYPAKGYSQIKACIDIIDDKPGNNGVQNGVFDFNSKWTNGATINVMFSGGTQFVQSKVIYYSKIWEQYANINFRFIASGTPDILVSFEDGKGSWSYIGMNSKYYAARQTPSMNFGWFNDNTDDNEFKRTILHEFGHVLGLLHEHKNPYGDIKWNLPVVYNYYQAQGWSIDKIKEQVLSKYSVTLSNHKYDEQSIMHYPIPANFTTDGYTVGMNTELSAGDRSLIAEMYPKSNKPVVRPVDPSLPANKNVNCTLNNIEILHNVYSGSRPGMKLFLSFSISNARATNCKTSVYYYYAGGAPLKDGNNFYRTNTGNVAVTQDFTPIYENTNYNRLEIFMPYDELEMADGKHDLKFSVSIWSQDNTELIQSGSYYFTYTKGIICNDLNVFANYDNLNRTMVVMPKFTISNAFNLDCTACVYFYYQNGNPIVTVNNTNLYLCQNFRPAYNTAVYNSGFFSDFFISVPYYLINTPPGTYAIKYYVALFNNGKQFATSGWYNSTFTR